MPSYLGRHCPLIGLFAGLLLAGGAAGDERRFTPQELCQDLAFIASEVRANHPDPAHSVDAAAFERTLQALQSSLSTPLTRGQAWAALSSRSRWALSMLARAHGDTIAFRAELASRR